MLLWVCTFLHWVSFLLAVLFMSIVNKKGLAEICGVDPRTVGNWIDEGMPVDGGGGRGRAVEIDTKKVIDWLIVREISKRYGDEEAEGSGGRKGSDEDRALKRLRGEEIALRLEIKRKEVAPVEGFMDIALRIASVFASQLDGLSSRTCSALAAMDDPAEIRAYLHGETRQIRASTAEQLVDEIQQLITEADELLALSDSGRGESASDEDGQ